MDLIAGVGRCAKRRAPYRRRHDLVRGNSDMQIKNKKESFFSFFCNEDDLDVRQF